MVLLTVRSLVSCLRTFSYSAMAFCSLPCWTNFSAALRTFCLLNPKPNAIRCADSSLFPAERPRYTAAPNRSEPRREIPRRNSANRQPGWRSKVIVRPGRVSPMVTDDYQGLPKGSVRPVFGKIRSLLPEWEQRRRPDARLTRHERRPESIINVTYVTAKTSN